MFTTLNLLQTSIRHHEFDQGRTKQPQEQFGGSQGELAAVRRYFRPVRR